MAAFSQGGTILKTREQKEIYDIERFYRYEITPTNSDYVVGEIYIRKDVVDAADAEPDTFALTTA